VRLLILVLLLVCAPVWAHQWTPTYYAWRPSHIDNVYVTDMMLWNAREEIEYFEIEVFDQDFNPVRFVTNETVIHVPHLRRKTIGVYVSSRDKDRAVYICSRSKILSLNITKTVIESRICSKSK
jgi:hypothetical protein